MTKAEIILIVLLVILLVAMFIVAAFIIINMRKKKAITPTDNNTNEVIKNSLEILSKNIIDNQKNTNDLLQQKIKMLEDSSKKQIDEIRELVSTKMSQNIEEKFSQTFKTISDSLTEVGKSMGEIKKFDVTASNLVAAMKNVKVSGVFGETQLSNILQTFLAPGQYIENFQSNEEKQERVEFAIKFPTSSEKEFVYLPIDSKFSLNVFLDLIEAQKTNNEKLIKDKTNQLKQTIIGMAKDIRNKYINPPRTTNYAIMFIPAESLYLQIVKMGLLDEIQNKYQVTMAGPTTISALLISFQMGFKTFNIQRKANEIWTILSALKAQFNLLEGEIKSVNTKFKKVNEELDQFGNTRFRMIRSKLKEIDEMSADESDKIIGMNDPKKIEQVNDEEKEEN